MNMENVKLNSIEIQQTNVEARKGVPIYRALNDAAILALIEDRRVVLKFNNREYVIDPHVLIDRIGVQHAEQYGEEPAPGSLG